MREFDTGATRNNDDTKLDYEAFLSPSVLKRFAVYMNSHRKQADGKLREGDNWQKGIPQEVYMKSMTRHFMDLWQLHRGIMVINPDSGEIQNKEELLCAIMFNVQGMLHEELKKNNKPVFVPMEMMFEDTEAKEAFKTKFEKILNKMRKE